MNKGLAASSAEVQGTLPSHQGVDRLSQPCGLVDADGKPVTVSTLVRLVGDEVFGPGAAQCLTAAPLTGAAGTTYRLAYDHQGQRSTLYVKLPTRSVERRAVFAARLREEYRVTAQVRTSFPETVALRTVAPVAFIEAVDGYASWAAPGDSLEGHIRKSARRFGPGLGVSLARCAQAAAWLDAFHGTPDAVPAVDARPRLAEYYEERLATLAGIAGSGVNDALAADLQTALLKLLDAELARSRLVLCHNDYSPHNMLVDGPTLTVLDYSFAGPGLPAFDVACFWHKLDGLRESPWVDPGRVSALQAAFVQAGATPFKLDSAAATLGLARLVLAKMITRLRAPARRPDQRLVQSLKHRRWLRWLRSGFDAKFV